MRRHFVLVHLRDPVTVEPLLCEPDPLETDVAFVSNVVTRVARLLTICSIFVILAPYEATVWESVWTQFSNRDTLCMGGPLRNLYEHFVDFLLHRAGTVSCSFEVRKRAVGRTHIRRGGWCRRYWHVRSITRTCHEKGWETTKLGCRHLDKTKPETLVNGKNTVHIRTGNGLSQNGYGCEQELSCCRCVVRRARSLAMAANTQCW